MTYSNPDPHESFPSGDYEFNKLYVGLCQKALDYVNLNISDSMVLKYVSYLNTYKIGFPQNGPTRLLGAIDLAKLILDSIKIFLHVKNEGV
jgi:hypothetical protein